MSEVREGGEVFIKREVKHVDKISACLSGDRKQPGEGRRWK